jgi:hypothetical protein
MSIVARAGPPAVAVRYKARPCELPLRRRKKWPILAPCANVINPDYYRQTINN